MGYFSFTCALSGKSIPIESDVILVLPDNTIKYGVYDGYGRVVCNSEVLSVYNLLAKLNYGEDDNKEVERMNGIAIFYGEKYCRFPLKILRVTEYSKYYPIPYSKLKPSVSCKYQGFFYPDIKAREEVQTD